MDRRGFISNGAMASVGLAALPDTALAASADAAARESVRIATKGPVQDGILRLNHNANPLGIPPKAHAAMMAAMDEVPHYPGPRDETLIAKIAQIHGVSDEQVVLGAGSTEVIRMAMGAYASPDARLLQANPTYENAMDYAEPYTYRLEQVPLTDDFAHDVERMRRLAGGWTEPTVVYICNPNNPTGTITPSAELDDWFASASDNVFFIVDEAYYPFVNDSRYWSAEKWANERPNVLITRTFSKLYGIAGLRIGYGICGADTAERLKLYATRSNPNTLAVEAAIGALEDEGWYDRSLAIWDECKVVVTECLDELELHYFKSHTAFLFHEIRGDQDLYIRRMEENGILVGRPFPPMLNYNRLSLSATPDGLERFADTLRMFRRRGWV